MLVCYIKRRKSFFTTYFHDLLHGDRGGYRGFQGVTRGYRRLQGITKDYRGLQRVTKTFFLLERR